MLILASAANVLNSVFASVRVKDFEITFDVPDAKTYIEVEQGGVLHRHALKITIGRFLSPSPGKTQLAVWKKMLQLVKEDELGELRYINFNGTIFSVDDK